jgi:hypothetical protein
LRGARGKNCAAGILPKLDDMNLSTWETTDTQFLDQIVRQFSSNAYFGS